MIELATLLPHLAGLRLERIVLDGHSITLSLAVTKPTASCPKCKRRSRRVHQRYQRTVLDLPCAGRALILRLHVRRFRCDNARCVQSTFAERLPTLVSVRARRSHGQLAALADIGFALGGSAGARLARRQGLSASRATILRLLHAATHAPLPTPRVLGIDDWARRRGETYGTILIDLERRRPVDLLPDRTAETLGAWLREHPGVEVIARDRAGAYAEGARLGAPGAVHVADRFHLLMNIGEAVERVLTRKHPALRAAATAVDVLRAESAEATSALELAEPECLACAKPTRQEQNRQSRRSRRLERYQEVIGLHRQGYSLREIGRRVGISKNTVKRFVRAGVFPERAERPCRPTILTPYESYLRCRWADGCRNAHTLWEEIRGQGCTGSASLVREFVGRWRIAPGRRGPTPRHASLESAAATVPRRQPTRVLSPRQARWLLLRPVDELRPAERMYREQLLAADEELHTSAELAREFVRIVHSRDGAALHSWLVQARNCGIEDLRLFALSLRRDLAAVEAALTFEWSNGQTEGHINRLKLLKRQMYGRASLRLLRQRFLRVA